MDTVTVYKLDHQGRESTATMGGSWPARRTGSDRSPLRGRDQARLGPILLRRGDRMVEWFYADRWYNNFEIHAAADDGLKGWYCNITRPAPWMRRRCERRSGPGPGGDPGGEMVLVDEDEFEALDIPRRTARRR
jgi:hypothetical protein